MPSNQSKKVVRVEVWGIFSSDFPVFDLICDGQMLGCVWSDRKKALKVAKDFNSFMGEKTHEVRPITISFTPNKGKRKR